MKMKGKLSKDNPLERTDLPRYGDPEAAIVAAPSEAINNTDVSVDRDEIVNLFVALKSKTLTILAGPAHSGKAAIVHDLASSLSEPTSLRTQIFTAHPWWAEKCENIAALTRLHERFSTEKVVSLIEEAAQPSNANQIYLACLTHISPAELLSFFTDVAFQLQHNRLMRIGDVHFSTPLQFPPNLRIIGTMDIDSFEWWNDELLRSTTVIDWTHMNVLPAPVIHRDPSWREVEFLQSSIQCKEMAFRKLAPVLRRMQQPLYHLLRIDAILKRYSRFSLDSVVDEAIIYLANSWSRLGNGLFHPYPNRNLTIALDLAISQILLPRMADAMRRFKVLRNRLKLVLSDQFVHSMAFVNTLSYQD